MLDVVVPELVVVSIRSPHKSKGRLSTDAATACSPGCFNPLPSQKQGETWLRTPASSWTTSFNPLPSQKQGETLFLDQQLEDGGVSIRSPHKSKGRLDLPDGKLNQHIVSIRSPHKSKGRRYL